MRFYLNNVEVQVEVAPNFKQTLDITLDTAQVTLKINSIEKPYAPMQSFRIEIDNNNILYYYVATDNVEVVSHSPLRYRHILGLVQTTKILTKPIVKNSSFTQPPSKYKSSHWGISQMVSYEEETEGQQGYVYKFKVPTQGGQPTSATPLTIGDNERAFGDVFVEIETYGAGVDKINGSMDGDLYKFDTLQEWNTYFTNKRIDFTKENLYVYYTLNGVAHHDILVLPNNNLLSARFKSSQITSLIKQGANNLYIGTLKDSGGYYTKFLTIPDDMITVIDNKKCPIFSLTRAKIVLEVFNYSAYDILNLLIKRQQKETDNYIEQPLFNLPQSGELHDLLVNTKAPNFVFTQCTMYACVYEIFKLFDAIFTLDNNNTLGIEYLNDYDRITSNLDFTSENITINDETRVNGYIAYYQDARQEEIFPSKNSYCHLRSSELGVPTQDDHNFILPHSINAIIKAEVNVKRLGLPTGIMLFNVNCHNFAFDITDYVFEKSLWSLLSTTNIQNNTKTPVQNNTIYWVSGDNKLQLGFHNKTWYATEYYTFWQMLDTVAIKEQGLLNTDSAYKMQIKYPALDTFKDIEMRVKYITSVDGRTKIESVASKYKGEIIVNQSNGAIDLNRMGLNLLGISMKNGEPTLNGSHRFTNWNDRIKKGTTIEKNGDIWVANVVNTTIIKDGCYFSEIQFVKNFNALSQRIKLDREKRLSNISKSLTLKSEDNYIEYVYVSSSIGQLPTYQTIAFNYIEFANGLTKTFDSNVVATLPEFAICSVDIPNKILVNGVWEDIDTTECYIPLNKYGAGNCICFEMSFDSPISSGNRTLTTSGWFGSNQTNTDAIKYTNSEGWLEKATFKLCMCEDITFSDNFPIISENYDTCMTLPNLRLYKQPNEILALNYELCFLPIETRKEIDFIGNEFINDNAFTNDLINKEFYLYYTTTNSNFRYNILDTKGNGDFTKITSVSKYINNGVIELTFNHEIIANIKTWAICDSEGNIYFASNNSENGTSQSKNIYFVARHTRV